jgi:hypothetical protein
MLEKENPHNCAAVKETGKHQYDDSGWCIRCEHSVWKDCGCQ